MDCDHRTAWQWVRRWEAGGFEGIEHEQAGRGRKSWVIGPKGAEIVQKTTQEKPVNATHWSRATMALVAGVSESTVGRVWKLNGLKPHRVVGFKVSNDPRFEEKLVDIVALYLDPPEHAIFAPCSLGAENTASFPQKQGNVWAFAAATWRGASLRLSDGRTPG